MSKFRNRNMLLLFWCDNEKHMDAYDKLTRLYDYVSILHDRDLQEDGLFKKAHIHAFLNFRNAKWSSAISEEIGLELNYFEEPKSAKNSLLYLLHYNDPDKAQYDFSELKGPLKSRVGTILKGMSQTEDERVSELIPFILSRKEKLSITDFALYCSQNGYWADFRRSATIFIKILEEHNHRLQNKD